MGIKKEEGIKNRRRYFYQSHKKFIKMYVITLTRAVDVTELMLCIKLRISFCFAYLV